MELNNLFNNRSKVATIAVLAIFVLIIALILFFGGRGSDENSALTGQVSETLNLAASDPTESGATGGTDTLASEPVPLAIEEPAVIIADAESGTTDGDTGGAFDFIYEADTQGDALDTNFDLVANEADSGGVALDTNLDLVANEADSGGVALDTNFDLVANEAGTDPACDSPAGCDIVITNPEPDQGGGEGEGGGAFYQPLEATETLAIPPITDPEPTCDNPTGDCDIVIVNPEPQPEPEPEDEPLDTQFEANFPTEEEPGEIDAEEFVPEEEVIPEEEPVEEEVVEEPVVEEEVVEEPVEEPIIVPEPEPEVIPEAQATIRPAASKPPVLSQSGPADLLLLLAFAALASLGARRFGFKKNQ